MLRFAATEVVPRLAGTAAEIEQVLRALDGRFIPAGPSGSPLRGLVNVLPTGRNFYSVDPKAIPSRLAWEAGVALADSLLTRYRDDHGQWPQSVGLSVWGTSAMRTAGDDIAEVLALLGARPVWDDASRRVVGLTPIPLTELGRPRIDVTVRISGFFRDAFPHVVTMLDDAVRLVADLDEPAEDNYVRAHAQADLAQHGDQRRSTTRIFGSKPGTYGAGLLQLIDSRNWRDDADLAQVYTAWGGFALGVTWMLDLGAVTWLEHRLLSFRGGLVVVAHDRHLLDRLTTRILELDRGHAYVHEGGYGTYLEARADREEKAATAESSRRNLARRELAWLRQQGTGAGRASHKPVSTRPSA